MIVLSKRKLEEYFEEQRAIIFKYINTKIKKLVDDNLKLTEMQIEKLNESIELRKAILEKLRIVEEQCDRLIVLNELRKIKSELKMEAND